MPSSKQIHALIIEDDQTSINVLKSLLQQLAIHTSVITIDYGHDFDPGSLAKIDRPDVVFLDLEMPGTNGYRVLEHLRSDAAFEGVPIVAYTTHTSHLNRAREAGFHSFLGKPLDAAHFKEQLDAILNGIPVWEVP